MTRRTALLLVALLGLGALAPLAPASPAGAAPPKTFTTNDSSADPDADPGDGVCATAAGRCSLQAALDESVALRKGTIVGGGYAESVAIRGNITIAGPDRLTPVGIADLRIERGATLTIQDAALAEATAPYLVRGRLVIERTAFLSTRVGMRIDPSGSALLRNTLWAGGSPGIWNLGRLTLAYTTLLVPEGGRGIQTSAGGVTTLAATTLYGRRVPGMRACAGTTPVSEGYNAAMDATCGLTQPTDIGVLAREDDGLGSPRDSPRTDAIPPGVLGCGTTLVEDQGHMPRPADGNGDGVLGCDVGWNERQPSENEDF